MLNVVAEKIRTKCNVKQGITLLTMIGARYTFMDGEHTWIIDGEAGQYYFWIQCHDSKHLYYEV